MVDLNVTLAGVELKNPVIPASGTFGYGREYAELYDLDILGSFSWKGTTGQARLGNPQPRIAETPGGMLNAVGLQNPGIDAVIETEVPHIAQTLPRACDRQCRRFFCGGIRRKLPQAQRGGPGGAAGGEHLLPQCPRRREELRLRPQGRR